MIIRRKTYKELLARSELANELNKEIERLTIRAKLVDALEEETKRLADLITSETQNCKMGAWCKECIHRGVDHSDVCRYDSLGDYIIAAGGNVSYCKKHLHEVCPEFEKE